MQLEKGGVRMWNDLAEAFLKQYQYSTDMEPNHTQF